MAVLWSTQETKVFLDVWGADSMQHEQDGIMRNRIVYTKVASGLAELGYDRAWQRCKTKVKNLVQRYRKVS